MKRALENIPLPPGQIVGLLAGLVLDRLWPVPLAGPRAAHRTVGGALVVAGAWLTGWALWERRKAASGLFELEQPDRLVTSGPYRLTRHPMYVGWWLIHLGTGVFWGSGWILVTVPAAVLAEHSSVIAEEKILRGRYDAAFERYAEQVPRYLSRRSAQWPR